MRKNVCNSQETGVRTRRVEIVNHPAVLKILRVVNLLRVVFLVRRGPLGKGKGESEAPGGGEGRLFYRQSQEGGGGSPGGGTSVIITPPITPNNSWGFNKSNSQEALHLLVLSLLGRSTAPITPKYSQRINWRNKSHL